MSVTAKLGVVQKLLEKCAPGHEIRPTTHFFSVSYKGKLFRTLPTYENIELGHIRKMVRALEIDKNCANSHIPNLFNIKDAPSGQASAKS
jgi:hypothetical protein